MNLKPTKGRLILTIVLILLFVLLQMFLSRTFDAPTNIGIPFTFWETGCYGMMPQGVSGGCVNNFFFGWFVLDLIVWIIIAYFVSILIIRNKN